jgi:type III secretion protein Q
VNALAPAYTPCALPRLHRDEAEARTLLAQRVQRRECLLGDTAWELSIEPLRPGTAAKFDATDWLVHAEWAGAPFELHLPAAAADHWLRARFAELDLPALPPPIRSAAFEAALQDMLDALEAAGPGPARIHGVEEASPPAASSLEHHFGVTLASGALTLWATLSTGRLGLMLMSGLAAHSPTAPGPLGGEGVPLLLLRAEIGSASLSRAEIASLQPGDAIVLQECWIGPQGQLRLGHGDWGLRVRAEGAHLVVTEPFHLTEPPMGDDDADEVLCSVDAAHTPGQAREEAPQGLDALPVRLHFDLGQRSMSLSEVSALQVGQVVELARPLSQAVSIRANGVLVGTGELIEIGGRMAVAVTSLGPRTGTRE